MVMGEEKTVEGGDAYSVYCRAFAGLCWLGSATSSLGLLDGLPALLSWL